MAEPTNAEIAAALDELGDLYELDGAVVHRVLAYRNAAKAIRNAPVSVIGLARENRATELPAVGAIIQEKMLALADEGAIPAAEKLRAKFPPGLVALTRLPGLGPKRARRLHEELGIDSLEALQSAAEAHRIRELKGFGPKAEEALLATAVAAGERAAAGEGDPERIVLSRALAVAEPLIVALRAHPAAERVELAGSARRMTDSVKDIDIIACARAPLELARAAAALELVESAGTPTESGVRLRTHTGVKIDLRIVAPDQFGNLMQHFTGSRDHNLALRAAAVRRGLHISEYGVLDDGTGTTHRCAREEEVYALLGLQWIPPELRENRGELAAAAAGTLPELITAQDLRGDLHCHTNASDGRATIAEMARAAAAAGYEYLAITDHSSSVGVRISGDGLAAHIERIRSLSGSREAGGITLLAGSEVNILPDGSLDYEDEILAELDWVVGSVHSSFGMDSERMTARLLAAIKNPLVDAIGHLTGRKIQARPPYALDVPAVIEAAARTGTFLEINASPDRRDMNEHHARAAASAGVGIVIDCDAHRTGGFEVARYGIATARRAWLGPEAVVNCRPWEELAALRPRARAAA
ncbi:MAG TPA: DNA polymerase/3'-5' exonuclease PolX [Solirubrobacteraceae bacterium]|nr:DNA polymerase/3'-5' exonuclease PolX [Solirubrobacteraceae bacterium]